MTREEIRLSESGARRKHWKRWGPYLSERAWGTVREDYSPYGNAWEYLSHDQARSRAYRWNEDGLAGISDRKQMICFALALWNERDPILKERIFGLTGNEGNHGEDVKEYYFSSIPRWNFRTDSWWPKIGSAERTSRSSNCSTLEYSTTIAISMCSSNMPKPTPKTY